MTNNKKIFIVDGDTGHILKDFDANTHSIRSNKQQKAFKDRTNGRNSEFTFTDMEAIQTLIAELEAKDCGYLLFLQCFINYDGMLINRNHEKTPMTRDDIQETLELGRKTFMPFFKRMIELDVIQEKGAHYYVNQKYHFRGTTDNQKVIRSFTARVRTLYTKKNAKDLGFVYKLLPYVHYETNTICHNPFEKDVKQINYMSQLEIAELTKEDESTIWRKMNRLVLGGEYLFAEIKVGKEKFYKINPFVFYRKNGKPDATLNEIFLIKNSKKR